MSNKVFIKTATQISIQQPLSEKWMECPAIYDEPYTRSIEPNFRDWMGLMESRRMGKILKRALVTATKAMDDAAVPQPDAIITGTGLGCIENTEVLLEQLFNEGEEMLKPTCFMQSTHNTISSLISINRKCHGYNSTYSHKSVSFESALMDAFLQIRLGDIQTALVTGNDEMTPSYFKILQRIGFLGQTGQVTAGEASAAMVLTTTPADALCMLKNVRLSYKMPQPDGLPKDVDAIMVGTNGCENNDRVYKQLAELCPKVPLLHYKHIFGESYTASALGIYASAHILKRGEAPVFMRCEKCNQPLPVSRLLFVNHSDGKCFSYVLMSSINNEQAI